MDEVLIFRIGSAEWAIPAHEVCKVLPPRPATRLPDPIPFVRGLVAWRARVLPLLALGERLGCDDPPVDQSGLLVVETEGELVALAVDEVMRFAQVQLSADGRIEVAGRAVPLLDLEQVLSE